MSTGGAINRLARTFTRPKTLGVLRQNFGSFAGGALTLVRELASTPLRPTPTLKTHELQRGPA
eukprot:4097744-Pyramimonas_sp.AAC.1